MSKTLNGDNNVPLSEGARGEEVKKDIQGLLGSTKKFLFELLDIRKNTDQEGIKEAIIADILFVDISQRQRLNTKICNSLVLSQLY
ncbi:MAG: hypothetical protein KAJ23_05990 [Maribacter sp.]|nr:hypothetical protein [Maribacter sp.]